MEVCTLQGLEEINASDNMIRDMPEDVKNLKTLCSLDLTNNQFPDFPPEACLIPNLVTLIYNQEMGLKAITLLRNYR